MKNETTTNFGMHPPHENALEGLSRLHVAQADAGAVPRQGLSVPMDENQRYVTWSSALGSCRLQGDQWVVIVSSSGHPSVPMTLPSAGLALRDSTHSLGRDSIFLVRYHFFSSTKPKPHHLLHHQKPGSTLC
jgi:hypothetical protein